MSCFVELILIKRVDNKGLGLIIMNKVALTNKNIYIPQKTVLSCTLIRFTVMFARPDFGIYEIKGIL